MGIINLNKVPLKTGSIYPEPYTSEMDGRQSLRLGDAGGLSQFGANLVTLKPGAKSSLRHWHMNEDEFIMMTQGQLILVEDDDETLMSIGDCAAFPAGVQNGHNLVNRSNSDAQFLVVGTKAKTETAFYSDIDMKIEIDGDDYKFTRKDGTSL